MQVLANASTGLITTDVFYWGNKVGDVGTNSPSASFLTSAIDKTAVLGGLAGVSLITSTQDFNRDGRVTAVDASTVLSSLGSISRLQIGAGGSFAPQAALSGLAAPTATAPVVGTAKTASNDSTATTARGDTTAATQLPLDFASYERSRLSTAWFNPAQDDLVDEALLDKLARAICAPKKRLPVRLLST